MNGAKPIQAAVIAIHSLTPPAERKSRHGNGRMKLPDDIKADILP